MKDCEPGQQTVMTLTIIRLKHSDIVNFIIALFILVSRNAFSPFAVFTSQIVTKENLFDQFYADKKVCLHHHTIFYFRILVGIPVSRRI